VNVASEQTHPAVVRRFGALARFGFFLCLMVLPRPGAAAIDDILEAIRQSEFRFSRAVSEVPFFPAGWLQYHFYPSSEFRDEAGVLPSAEVTESTIGLGGVLPVYVEQRDMVLLGGDVASDTIKVRSGPYRDQRILRVTPVAAWLHQFGKDDMLGAFVAPIFSQETLNDQPWSVSGFAGVIGMHWQSDTLQWFYGGVYEQSFGEEAFYPYLGLQWAPTPQWVLALLFPWPTISYAPAHRWLLQVGIAPGGSSWISRGDGFESTQTFGSWNLNAGIAYQLEGPWWLHAGAGLTGLRGLTHNVSGDETWFEAQSSPVYTVAIQFRP
jgi:hypothetical protein